MRRRLIILLSSITVVAAAVVIDATGERRHYICPVCGLKNSRLYLGSVVLSEHTDATPLSEILARHALTSPHGHRWVFFGGNGGVFLNWSCILGNSRILYASYDHRALSLIESLADTGDRATAEQVREAIVDETRQQKVEDALAGTRAPVMPFETPAEFNAWWAAHGAEVRAALAP